jgi:hypothetical protein
VAHHDDRRLPARAGAQGALGRAEQHRYNLGAAGVAAFTSAALQQGPFDAVDALELLRSVPTIAREWQNLSVISPKLMVNT